MVIRKIEGLVKVIKNKYKGSQASQKQIKRVKINIKANIFFFSNIDMLDKLNNSKSITNNNSY